MALKTTTIFDETYLDVLPKGESQSVTLTVVYVPELDKHNLARGGGIGHCVYFCETIVKHKNRLNGLFRRFLDLLVTDTGTEYARSLHLLPLSMYLSRKMYRELATLGH